MKVVIDIPNEEYERVIAGKWKGNPLADYIENGKPYEESPTGKWISVSERLPNRNGVYNVTRIIEGTRLTDACYFDGQNTWHEDICVNHGRPYLIDVIAWQPLPESYKKGGEEE